MRIIYHYLLTCLKICLDSLSLSPFPWFLFWMWSYKSQTSWPQYSIQSKVYSIINVFNQKCIQLVTSSSFEFRVLSYGNVKVMPIINEMSINVPITRYNFFVVSMTWYNLTTLGCSCSDNLDHKLISILNCLRPSLLSFALSMILIATDSPEKDMDRKKFGLVLF